MPNVKINTRKPRSKPIKNTKQTKIMRKVAKQVVMNNEKKNVELKYFTLDGAAGTPAIADAAPELLSRIGVGVSENQRLGARITYKKLYFNIHFEKGPGSLVPQTCRLIVFKNMSTADPDTDDLLSTAVVSDVNQIIAANFYRDRKGLIIIDDIVTVDGDSYEAYDREYEIPLNGQCVFAGDGASSAETGSLWVLLASTQGTGTASPPYRWSSRIVYTDQ